MYINIKIGWYFNKNAAQKTARRFCCIFNYLLFSAISRRSSLIN